MNNPEKNDPEIKLQNKKIRAEVVGSMLRTKELLNARELHQKKELSDTAFKKIEDQAVKQCLNIQEESGVDIVTDGEVRRDVFASQLAQASEGFGVVKDNWVDWFDQNGKIEKDPVTVAVVGKIKRKRHLSAEEFCFIRGITKKPIKVTLPSPTMIAYYWLPGTTDKVYASRDDFLKDIAAILDDEVAELVRLGATYIQFDAPEFGMLIDEHQRKWFQSKGFDPEQLIIDGINLMNETIDKRPEITFGLHICRGNDKSRYMAKGDYSKVAQLIFPKTHAQRLLLEFDDERSGDFAPLQLVPKDKIVVLGLVTTKTNRQETAEELKARIEEASQFIPKERLALSTQCGFASVAKGNAIDFPTQLKKLKLVADVADEVWRESRIRN